MAAELNFTLQHMEKIARDVAAHVGPVVAAAAPLGVDEVWVATLPALSRNPDYGVFGVARLEIMNWARFVAEHPFPVSKTAERVRARLLTRGQTPVCVVVPLGRQLGVAVVAAGGVVCSN